MRGSIPSPGKETYDVGGNTSCVEVRVGNQIIILDAGSGIRRLGQSLMKEMTAEGLERHDADHVTPIGITSRAFPFSCPPITRK